MEYYKLRIDLSISIAKIVNLVAKASNSYCYVLEKLEHNPHVHFYLETLVLNETLRARIRKLCGKGNRSYSLKKVEKHPMEYLAYLLKEGKPVYVNIPDVVISESIAYDEKVKADLKAKKSARLKMPEKILAYMEEKKWNINPPNILTSVLMYVKENKILVREFYIISLVQTICLQNCDGYLLKLSNKIRERME